MVATSFTIENNILHIYLRDVVEKRLRGCFQIDRQLIHDGVPLGCAIYAEIVSTCSIGGLLLRLVYRHVVSYQIHQINASGVQDWTTLYSLVTGSLYYNRHMCK